MVETADQQTTCAFVALIGAPNAGKSTLLNRLVGQKVSIVTHKVQTTRMPVRGIVQRGNAQIVFVDTPGIFTPKKPLERAMVQAAWGGTRDADIIALLVDAALEADRESTTGRAIAARLVGDKRPCILVLNKIDLVARETLLALASTYNDIRPFDAVFMLSALTGDGVDDVLDHLAQAAPSGPWMFPADQASDVPLRLLAAEVTREKLFLRLHDELPYALSVETERWQEQRNGSVRVEQIIYVERDSQKKIVLGRGGRTVRDVSIEARKELAALLERPVHLFLFVKVRPKWTSDPARYREIGLDLDQ